MFTFGLFFVSGTDNGMKQLSQKMYISNGFPHIIPPWTGNMNFSSVV